MSPLRFLKHHGETDRELRGHPGLPKDDVSGSLKGTRLTEISGGPVHGSLKDASMDSTAEAALGAEVEKAAAHDPKLAPSTSLSSRERFVAAFETIDRALDSSGPGAFVDKDT